MREHPSGEGPGDREDIDAVFAQIVADLQREGVGVNVPSEAEVKRDHAEANRVEPEPPAESVAAQPTVAWRGHGTDYDLTGDVLDAAEDEHYEPPEPPPLPRLRPATLFAIGLMILGVLLLALPGVIGLGPRVATPIALLSLASGIGLLLFRVRKTPPVYPDGDDGAQV
ncbi:MAG: hypothetical protein M3548_20495 [Actinomycetota bacterium]|nr:hypothetical protein [Actinomycetota bacterium]